VLVKRRSMYTANGSNIEPLSKPLPDAERGLITIF
jgi:hypothetical protein